MSLRLFIIYLLLNSHFVHAEHTYNSAENSTKIIVLGDSLSAGYGIELEEGWVNLLRHRLQKHHSNSKWNVVNASINGDTTAGGLERLPNLIQHHQPVLCIIALGANDGLRGLPLNIMQTNLEEMVKHCSLSGTSLLVGMKLPPNYGEKYTNAFHQIYSDVAKIKNINYVPFMLDNIALHDTYFQADRLHPTSEAQSIILDNIWSELDQVLIKINLD